MSNQVHNPKPRVSTIGRDKKPRTPTAPFHYLMREDGRRVIDRKRWEADQAKLDASQ
jgi:hypothetical protein